MLEVQCDARAGRLMDCYNGYIYVTISTPATRGVLLVQGAKVHMIMSIGLLNGNYTFYIFSFSAKTIMHVFNSCSNIHQCVHQWNGTSGMSGGRLHSL